MKIEKQRIFRNPFALALGVLIQRRRKALGTGSEFAKQLEIGDSTLRLFEVGKNAIPVEKAVNLCKVFSDFNFSNVVKVLTVLHYLQESYTLAEVKSSLKMLSKLDADLKPLLQEFLIITDKIETQSLTNLNSINELLEELNVLNYLDTFLTSKSVVTITQNKYEEELINHLNNKISSYDVDDVLSYSNVRAHKPLQVANETLMDWERENKEKIDEILGITLTYKSLTTPENMELFDYEYVNDGAKMRVIYMDETDLTPHTIKEEFIFNLKDALSRKLKWFDIEQKKENIQFASAGSSRQEIRDMMRLTKNESQFYNLWIYRLTNGRVVGFLASEFGRSNNFLGVSPTQDDLRNKIDDFNNIWKLINNN